MTAHALPLAAPAARDEAALPPREAPGEGPGAALFPPAPDLSPAFELRPAANWSTALVFASPHSGRLYPAEMMAQSVLDERRIRGSEDAFVDHLVSSAPAHGAPLLLARHARAYVDLNRAPYELDPGMFSGTAAHPCQRTPRAAAGLGSVARVVGEGCEIYRAPLAFAEAEARLNRVHAPWHAELSRLMDESVARFGCAVLLDWHSMPAAAVRTGRGPGPDMVIGDRHGAAAGAAVSRRVEAELERAGWRVARNRPYAGGYVAERHGRPAARRHAVQLEIRRDLYLDEARLVPAPGFDRFRERLAQTISTLAATDWAALA